MTFCRANIWTPRGTTQLWPKGGERPRVGLKQCTFNPTRSTPRTYQAPPPPPPLHRTVKKQITHDLKSAELVEKAEELRQEAERLEHNTPHVSLPLQFGTLVLDMGIDAFAKRYLKEWDQRGRGEVQRRKMPSLGRYSMCYLRCG